MKAGSLFVLHILLAIATSAQGPEWVRTIGGNYNDYGWGIAVDREGGVIGIGSFEGTVDLDPGPGVANVTSEGGYDIFIVKLGVTGDFLWGLRLGRWTDEKPWAVTTDTLNNIYIACDVTGLVDVDPGPDEVLMQLRGLLLKLDPNGNFIWAVTLDGASAGAFFAVNAAPNGLLYVAGGLAGTADMDPGPGVFTLTPLPNGGGSFALVLDLDGNFQWAAMAGGGEPRGIDHDAMGNVYVTGAFSGTINFNVAMDDSPLSSVGYTDGFVTKLDHNGVFQWARSIGGPGYDFGYGLVSDAEGNSYCTGGFTSDMDGDPGLGVQTLTCEGVSDAFLLKLDTNGDMVWVLDIAGAFEERGLGIALNDPYVHVAGMGLGVSTFTTSGAFVSEFFHILCLGVAVGDDGALYAAAAFSDTYDFDPGPGVLPITAVGEEDAAFMKLRASVGFGAEHELAQLSAYPNPATMYIRIDGPFSLAGTTAEVFDMTGARVALVRPTTASMNLDVSQYSSGIYLLRVRAPFGVYQTRIIVE